MKTSNSPPKIHLELASIVDSSLSQLNEYTIAVTEIPAPPFQEQKRAEYVRDKFQSFGYHARIDGIGNVLVSSTDNPKKLPVLSAHLDTVFSNEEIKVIREGDRLYAPGIGDDGRGLGNLLLIAKLLKGTKYESEVLFVATVGEEGMGDLRGVKYLFANEEHKSLDIPIFMSIDGTGLSRIVNQGIGSIRYRIHIRGPGGHSFGSFGLVNPTYALSSFINDFSSNFQTKGNFKTTYSIGKIGGGTSINAIPDYAWADIDLRSEDAEELQSINAQMKKFAISAVKKENKLRDGEITLEFEQVGNRPAGKLSAQWVYDCIEQVHKMIDMPVQYAGSSTDANVPLNMHIPAIALGSVEESGRAHSQEEWIDASQTGLICVKRNLLLLLSVCDYLKQV